MLNISERFWMLEEVMVFETGLVIKAGHISNPYLFKLKITELVSITESDLDYPDQYLIRSIRFLNNSICVRVLELYT